ncbi:MAG: hypothetical protein RL591_1999 [Planctomycetota bacterium]
MTKLSKFLLPALLVVTALFPSVAKAQVVPTSYSLGVGGFIYDKGAYGGDARHLATDEVWEFGDSCGQYSVVHGRVTNTASAIETSLTWPDEFSYIQLSMRFTAGVTGAWLRYTDTALSVTVEVEAAKIPPNQSFWLAPNQTADASVSSWNGGFGSMQVLIESGDLVNVFAEVDWYRKSASGNYVGGSCTTIGCVPEIDELGGSCGADTGSGDASVDPNRIELNINSGSDSEASQSLQFTVTADCCVTYNLQVDYHVDWYVSFLGAPYNQYRGGKINVPAGSYSVSHQAGYKGADSTIILIFAYGFCDDDCDADGQLDSNQIKWGWAPDVNSNGVLDVCDLRGGDLNLDGVVGSADLTLLLGAWGGTLPEIIDLTGDGVVSTADLSFLFSKWNM